MCDSNRRTRTLAEDMKQAEMYARLRQIGSSWLKKSVVYADRQLIVINKPPGLICQLNHKSKGKETVGPESSLSYDR